MAIRKLPGGTIEADTPAEMREYRSSEPERDLRTLDLQGQDEPQPIGRGFITPLFCFLPIKGRNWILTPLACFYKPTTKR